VARKRGEVALHLSLPDLEECVAMWDTNRATALRRLRIVRDLVGFESLLKQPSDILAEAIHAYAARSPAPSPSMARPQRRHVASSLQKIASDRATSNKTVRDILAAVKKQKEEFKGLLTDGRSKTLAELLERYTPRQLAALPFDQFFAIGAQSWAEDFARPLGLADVCRTRGLEGLLGVRPVRLCVGTLMSVIHSLISAWREPEIGDGYDIWHAILASTADVFVTRDARLYEHIARIPSVDGFRVVTSLGELLTDMGTSRSR
jgi:hypothetical protein